MEGFQEGMGRCMGKRGNEITGRKDWEHEEYRGDGGRKINMWNQASERTDGGEDGRERLKGREKARVGSRRKNDRCETDMAVMGMDVPLGL